VKEFNQLTVMEVKEIVGGGNNYRRMPFNKSISFNLPYAKPQSVPFGAQGIKFLYFV
jgi:hypothetical protein